MIHKEQFAGPFKGNADVICIAVVKARQPSLIGIFEVRRITWTEVDMNVERVERF